LEVREVDFVGIRDGEPADSGRGEVERRRAAEAARADDERTGGAQPLLSLYADLRKENVPAVAEELLVVQFRGRQLDFVVAPAGLVFSGVGACWPFTGSPFRKASACASWKSSLEPSSVGLRSPFCRPGLVRGSARAGSGCVPFVRCPLRSASRTRAETSLGSSTMMSGVTPSAWIERPPGVK